MSTWLKKGKETKLVIVGLEQSFGHYHGVSLKLGLNLLKLKQSGQVIFYEGLKQIPSLLEQNLEELQFVKRLYEDIAKLVTDNCLIVIDQVSILSFLGLSTRSIYILCHYLTLLVNNLVNCQVIFGLFQSNDGDGGQLVHLVSRCGSLNISVHGLETGLSKDVSGVMDIVVPGQHTRSLQFKILDKDVKVFALGTCTAVL